ncbi:MAG: hypothetical protein IJE10_01970 [Clostridia bacterium]|nr:hypothetical protein [Clostridia bacterium]
MFYFEQNYICFEDGISHPLNRWLAQQSLTDERVFKLLCGAQKGQGKINAQFKDGKLMFEGDAAEVAVGMLKILELPINRCENCGRFFAPQSRTDEKYCNYVMDGEESCRKIGAGKTFRKNNEGDAGYTEFMKHTKHLRYLKNKGKLSESAFKQQYAEAKKWLAEYRNGNLQTEKIASALPEPEIKPQTRENIASYLL